MFKQTALIHWNDDSAARDRIESDLTSFPGAARSVTGKGLPRSYNGGDLVWHLHFPDETAWQASGAWDHLDALERDPAVKHIDAVTYAPDPLRLTKPALQGGVCRTLFVNMFDHATPAQADQWLAEILGMPDYIPEILNAASGKTLLSRGARRWSHVWEQEYARLEDVTGPYMASPYHWAFVDRWFDPEMPEFIIDTLMCHSISTLTTSVIRDYGDATGERR